MTTAPYTTIVMPPINFVIGDWFDPSLAGLPGIQLCLIVLDADNSVALMYSGSRVWPGWIGLQQAESISDMRTRVEALVQAQLLGNGEGYNAGAAPTDAFGTDPSTLTDFTAENITTFVWL